MFKDTEENKTVTVLGKTFKSEEERRNYFREELRKQLPELKKMEGFPIGEDEDILKLSDPPYYTACPNPWLNNFVDQWEAEKEELEKQGKRKADFHVDSPYAADVSEGKNNPIYNAHSYHTKVPHPAIMRYILHYTQPGDVVLDAFAGTGMTGVAARLCGDIDAVKSLGFQVQNDDTILQKTTNKTGVDSWIPFSKLGERKAVLNDLSPAASFIASNYNSPIDVVSFEKEARRIVDEVENDCGWMFETKHSDGRIGKINYTVWSDVFICPHCSADVNFWEAAVEKDSRSVKDIFSCPNCNSSLTKRRIDNAWQTVYDPISGESIKKSKQVPVLITYSISVIGKKSVERHEKVPDADDLKNIKKIDEIIIPDWYPTQRLINGKETRRNVKIGITHVHHFYTNRNLYMLSRILSKSKTSVHKLLFQSINATLCSRLVRYNMGKRGNGPLNGTLYVSSLNAEAEILKIYKGKLKDFVKAFILKNHNIVQTASSENIVIPDNSIDYIFIDPPFGANLNYSELSFIWEAWLKVITNNSSEAIENSVQGKGPLEYRKLMTSCFREAFRILKPGKWMTVEFSNTKASVWNNIQTALTESGFLVANVSALDKKQGSFKAVTTPTAVKQDLVISLYKPSLEFESRFRCEEQFNTGIWDFIEEHLMHLNKHIAKENKTVSIVEREPKLLYDRLIKFYVQRNLLVPIDAVKFQEGLRERFIERDGMFFTQEQVQEYDKKKAEVPEFIQLSLLVSSEQDGVFWLRNLLRDNSQTYQDIQPLWMQALAGMRKGDLIPELASILEENFLKDEEGKWYLPDSENEADLEKLRNKRLLKQFDAYKEEAVKPKGKIKEARVEALRVGFKQCYQDKDFKTIVLVGDRIPNNLLMEDEVLLQFYDIASSKV